MAAVWHFYVAYIIARGLGNPVFIGVMPRTVAVNFFERKRNLVLGIVSMARPCFGAINVQLITLVSTWSSWRTAYKLLGVYSIILALPLLIFVRKDPESIGLLPDGTEKNISPPDLRLINIVNSPKQAVAIIDEFYNKYTLKPNF